MYSEDVLNPEIDENANADVSDVVNYVRAVNYAIERMETLPLCNRLIRETHRVLMTGVRGNDKTPERHGGRVFKKRKKFFCRKNY